MNTPVDRRLPAQRAKAALASLELATAMARVSIAKSVEPKPLYVRRDLLNASELLAWAKRAGIQNLVAPSEMHVTICYSRAPVDWLAMGNAWPETVIVPKGGPRVLARFGKTDAKVAVLAFASSDIEWRHREMCDRGASFDFPTYRPHVTIGLNLPADFDLDAVEPYRGVLRFGPEIFEPIDDNFTVRMAKAGWSMQPRVPSGPKGGQWTTGGYGGAMAGMAPKAPGAAPLAPAPAPKLTLPWLGQDDVATHRFKGDPQQAAFMKPMKESEMTGQPAWLDNDEGIVLKNPQTATHPDHVDNPDDRATFVAGHDPGPGLNGVPFKPWDGPEGGDWTKVDGTGDFDEPDLPATKGKRLGAGVVITEPDGRVWTLTPTNHFGGYFETLPKGGIEEGLNLRQTAIKEAWEESGLKVRLTGYIGDFERNTSVARYYRAERVGGDPTDYHWETAGTHLVPPDDLADALHHVNDKPILAALKGESDAVIKLALGFADLVELLGEIVEKGKAWSSQPRVPAGFPTGGRWMKGGYGQGGWGGMHAEQGVPLTLQKHGGTGPQSDALNAKIKMFEDAANQGYIHPAAQKLILKPKPTQTYSAAAWESANEAATYVHAMKGQGKTFGGAPMGLSTGTTKPAKPKMDATPDAYTAPSGTFKDPMKLSEMTKVGAKPGGSAAGALYKDANGDTWMVKSYDSDMMAFNEVTAAKFYEMMGVAVPQMKLIDLGEAHKGGIGVASKMMDLKPFDPFNATHLKAAQEDFAAHALMANWDAVGLSFDNLMIDAATGKTVMVDPGGSMLFRAQGGLKGDAFKSNVTELDTLRDATKNPQAAKVFGKMTQEQIVNSMQKALAGLGEQDELGGIILKQSAVDALVQHWDKAKNTTMTNLQLKMEDRVMDMSVKAKAMTAEFASTAGLDIATTGTTKAVKSHPNSVVEQMANLHSKADLEQIVDKLTKDSINIEAQMTGKSADYYLKHLATAANKAFAGDPDGVAATFVVPKSINAKLSPNYGLYKKSFENLKNVAHAQAALKLQDAAKLGDGGLVTGASKVTPADVTVALKDSGMTAPGTNMLEAGWTSAAAVAASQKGDPTNLGAQIEAANLAESMGASSAPKPAAKAVLDVPAAMPVMPKLSSPANPNLKLTALANEIAKIATSGEPDAAAKVQALAATIKGSNSFSMKAKTYAANVVAALGGQAAIDATPAAAKKKAQEAGIDIAAKVTAGKKTTGADGTTVETYTSGGVIYEKTTSVVQFDAKGIPEPPDFTAFNGGNPLSSKPEVNLANNASVQALYAKAMQNDIKGLMELDITVPGYASLPDSVKQSLPGGANKHVAGYKSHLIGYLQSVGQTITTEKVVGFEGGGSIGSAMAGISSKFKAKGPWTPGAAKVGGYIKSGSVGAAQAKAFWDSISMQMVKPNTSLAGKLKDMTYSQPVKAQKAMKAHVSGKSDAGWSQMQAALFTGKKGDKLFDTAMQNAKDLSEGVYEMPPGLVVGRKIPAYASAKEWQASIGDVLNIPALSSTAITPGVWSGEVALKMKFAPGAKGAYVGHTTKTTKSGPIGEIGLASEHEIILPKNTKIIPVRVFTNDGTDDFFGTTMKGKTIVEVLVIGNDDPEIH
jgi:ADP-ribose pyrophosphatase YjhB (NUDIX family)